MRKIAMIGAGGIQSWAAKHLREMIDVFFPQEMVTVVIYDADIVEEKNLKRNAQNFQPEDLLENKAEVIANRYKFIADNKFITEENIKELTDFDDVILGVDNHKTRKLIYHFCIENEIYCIDMRAQGTRMSYFVVEPTSNKEKQKELIEKYDKRFFSNSEIMERSGSCQLAIDIENDHIENANKAIAFFCMQCIYLKRWRKETLSTNEFEFVY